MKTKLLPTAKPLPNHCHGTVTANCHQPYVSLAGGSKGDSDTPRARTHTIIPALAATFWAALSIALGLLAQWAVNHL